MAGEYPNVPIIIKGSKASRDLLRTLRTMYGLDVDDIRRPVITSLADIEEFSRLAHSRVDQLLEAYESPNMDPSNKFVKVESETVQFFRDLQFKVEKEALIAAVPGLSILGNAEKNTVASKTSFKPLFNPFDRRELLPSSRIFLSGLRIDDFAPHSLGELQGMRLEMTTFVNDKETIRLFRDGLLESPPPLPSFYQYITLGIPAYRLDVLRTALLLDHESVDTHDLDLLYAQIVRENS